jgi:hypothetical protein
MGSCDNCFYYGRICGKGPRCCMDEAENRLLLGLS